MQKIDENIVNYIMENRQKESIREEVLQKYGIVLQDLDTTSQDDGLLVNKYPNIFTVRYQNEYISSLSQIENYVLFDISSGLHFQDQLVKYNFKYLNGVETTKPLQLYEHLIVGKHFEPKIVKKSINGSANNNLNGNANNNNANQNPTNNNSGMNSNILYFIALQYSPSIYRVSQFPQQLSFILSPKLDKKLLRTGIDTINSLEQEHKEKYQYKSYTESDTDLETRTFMTPLGNIIKQQIGNNKNDYLMQRQWYNIAMLMEKIEQQRRADNNVLEDRPNERPNEQNDQQEE